jgi:hypothetical protein
MHVYLLHSNQGMDITCQGNMLSMCLPKCTRQLWT